MKIDVETHCIISRENGEQVFVENPSSIMLEITVMGQTYHVFKLVQSGGEVLMVVTPNLIKQGNCDRCSVNGTRRKEKLVRIQPSVMS